MQQKMSVAARRRNIVYIIEQVILSGIAFAGFFVFLVLMRILLRLA